METGSCPPRVAGIGDFVCASIHACVGWGKGHEACVGEEGGAVGALVEGVGGGGGGGRDLLGI